MNNDEVCEKFKRATKYKNIGRIIMLFPLMSVVFFDDLAIWILLTSIVFAAGIYLLSQYKCPSCGFVFDCRVKSHELVYC